MALDTRESIPEISVFHVHRQEALDLVQIAEFYLSPTLAHHSVRLIRLPIVKTIKNRQREREGETWKTGTGRGSMNISPPIPVEVT